MLDLSPKPNEATLITEVIVSLAIGFIESEAVDKGAFFNVVLAIGDIPIEGSAYIATDDDGKPVSLAVRVMLDDVSDKDVTTLRHNVPVRRKTAFVWSDGTTQPVGRKGSRWTVGGPRVKTTARRGNVATGDAMATRAASDVGLTTQEKRMRTMLANLSDAERAKVLGS